MKKIVNALLGLAFMVCFLLLMGWAGYLESTYDMDGKVLSSDSHMVTVEDVRGHMWDATNKYEYVFHAGDKVHIVFFDNHTHTIYDDEIVKVIPLKK